MGEIVEFKARNDVGTPHITCECGEVWMAFQGVVVMESDGRITGYTGTFSCNSCGRGK